MHCNVVFVTAAVALQCEMCVPLHLTAVDYFFVIVFFALPLLHVLHVSLSLFTHTLTCSHIDGLLEFLHAKNGVIIPCLAFATATAEVTVFHGNSSCKTLHVKLWVLAYNII